jgi:hypothetical protein
MGKEKKVKIAGREYEAGADDYTTPAPMADKYGQKPQDFTKEHQTIRSRTNGKEYQIQFGPLPGGLVPANPFASLAQEKFMFSNKSKMEKQGVDVDEWAKASKGKKLPKRVK